MFIDEQNLNHKDEKQVTLLSDIFISALPHSTK
jgi:hypothetical protein